MMNIQNLTVDIGGKTILNGLDLNVEKGSVHAIMGLNGSGKSTLSKAIVGHYDVTVTGGEPLLYPPVFELVQELVHLKKQ